MLRHKAGQKARFRRSVTDNNTGKQKFVVKEYLIESIFDMRYGDSVYIVDINGVKEPFTDLHTR